MNMLRRALLALMGAGAMAATQAQTWPDKPIRLIIPYAPGGGADGAARLIATQLGKALGQTVFVESRAGGNTTIAGIAVARAPADGYTLLMTGGSTMSVLPLMNDKLPFDPGADLVPLGMVSRFPFIVAVSSTLNVKTLAEVLALARAKPGELPYASNGSGSMVHLGMELMAHSAQVKFNHVPYKGFAPALPDVITGRTPVMMADWAPISAHLKSGALKALAVTSAKRWALLPDVPTVAEQGFPGYEMEIWFGLYAPARTPAAVVMRINDEMRKWLVTAEAHEAFAAIGHEPAPSTPDDVRQRIAAEQKLFGPAIKAANIKSE
ncbi:MAG: tripartite tricarboxylate transporter substrate-binding protein [Caldimonas sp.]